MKIILSRKGFDTSNGKCPNPIFPDGTLLSLPIPSEDSLSFADLSYKGLSYNKILSGLNPKENYSGCHLDPDIRKDARIVTVPKWVPIFGQIGSAQGVLHNNNIGKDDLFLFFGRFQKTQQAEDGRYSYVRGEPCLHVIYGYLQVEKVLTKPEDVEKYWWHPHADLSRLNEKNNALYLARKTLSFDKSKPGFGVFNFDEDRVLTLEDRPMATWREIAALMPSNITSGRKNSEKGDGLYYKGIWQELVLRENSLSEEWAKSLFI